MLVDNSPIPVPLPNTAGTYTFTNVANNHTITASFNQIKPVINSSESNGGTISPLGSINVIYGTNEVYTYKPNTGYLVSNITIDGSPISCITNTGGTYTFSKVISNHTINASFNQIQYSITSKVMGGSGNITPLGTTYYPYDSSPTFSIKPITGQMISQILVDNKDVTTTVPFNGGNYVFSDLLANHTLNVTFKATPNFTITISGGIGGTVTPSGTITVPYGTKEVIVVTPNTGYIVSNLTVDKVAIAIPYTGGNVTFSSVTANHTVSVTFRKP